MENVLICLILMLLLVIAGVISRLVRSLPAPIVQISLGAIVSFLLPTLHIGFNPEIVMLLFIPPLLFSESWRFPKREFISNTRPIIMLSIGLVLFTVGGLGYLVHWLIPSIPLAASFALAAALSPTDAVALKSMTVKSGMPERIKHILQGEALLNDASGLVSFKFAVAAMLTGFFSMADATISLFVISAGGLLVGVILTYIFVTVLSQLSRSSSEETTTENLILILLPYAAYLSAEQFDFSGILAAVSAGFTMDKTRFLDKTMATMRIEGRFVWGMLETTLNGIIFILLGLYLPNSLNLIAHTGVNFSNCLMIVGIITVTLIACRFIWIYLTFPLEALIARHKNYTWRLPNFKIVAAMSLGGIRGAIALAAILSLPQIMPNGTAIPARDLLITLVVGVVICSLLSSAIILPLILPGLKDLMMKSSTEEENEARIAAARAAIIAIEQKVHAMTVNLNEQDSILCAEVANALMTSLNQFIASSIGEKDEKITSIRALNFEEVLRLAGLDAARQELHRLRKSGKINNTTMVSVMHRLDLRQISILNEHKATLRPSTYL